MKYCILIFIMCFIYGCFDKKSDNDDELANINNMTSKKDNKVESLILNKVNVTDSLKLFISEFTKINPDIDLNKATKFKVDFTKQKVISQNLVIRYFFSNNVSEYNEFDGSQYYYGYYYELSNELLVFLYYRTDYKSTGFFGYDLLVFNVNTNKVVDKLFVFGDKGEYEVEKQVEAKIFKNSIILNELNVLTIEDDFVKANSFTLNYEISEKGKIILINKNEDGIHYYIENKNNTRLEKTSR